MIFNYFESEKKLLYYDHDADEIPSDVINEFKSKDIKQIDFSSNSLTSLDFISYFSELSEVVLDNNYLSDDTIFPNKIFFKIQLLSLNNNKFEDLHKLAYNICYSFPNLRHLSLLGNPLCPALNANLNEEDYQNYRLFIISRMPKLKFLDAKMITKYEWTIIHSDALSENKTKREQKVEQMNIWNKIFKTSSKEAETKSDDDRDSYTPLPNEERGSEMPKSSYSKMKHFYKGTDSQGNRFIGNKML